MSSPGWVVASLARASALYTDIAYMCSMCVCARGMRETAAWLRLRLQLTEFGRMYVYGCGFDAAATWVQFSRVPDERTL